MAKDKPKKDRKPDYDEKEIPKVLKGPVEPPADKPAVEPFGSPLRARPDYGEAGMIKEIPVKDVGQDSPAVPQDYDEPESECGPSCPCQGDQGGVTEEVAVEPGDGQSMMMVLICPDCGNEGPIQYVPSCGYPDGSQKT